MHLPVRLERLPASRISEARPNACSSPIKITRCAYWWPGGNGALNSVRSDIGVIQDDRVATLFLIVGLPGAEKTMRAKELAAKHRALQLTPDEWMIPLFGDSMADGRSWRRPAGSPTSSMPSRPGHRRPAYAEPAADGKIARPGARSADAQRPKPRWRAGVRRLA